MISIAIIVARITILLLMELNIFSPLLYLEGMGNNTLIEVLSIAYDLFVIVGGFFIFVWLGIKLVLRYSRIRKEDFIKISLSEGLLYLLLKIIDVIGLSVALNLKTFLQFAVMPVYITIVTRYWLARLANNSSNNELKKINYNNE